VVWSSVRVYIRAGPTGRGRVPSLPFSLSNLLVGGTRRDRGGSTHPYVPGWSDPISDSSSNTPPAPRVFPVEEKHHDPTGIRRCPGGPAPEGDRRRRSTGTGPTGPVGVDGADTGCGPCPPAREGNPADFRGRSPCSARDPLVPMDDEFSVSQPSRKRSIA
jgi:hypothetical protein